MSGRMLSGVISTFRCRKPGLILCCYNLRQVHWEQEQLELAGFKDISSSNIYSSSWVANEMTSMGVHRCILASSPLPALSPSLLPLSFHTISLGSLCIHVLTVFSVFYPSHLGSTVVKKKICLPKQQMQETWV